jgi:hypothetical protein
MKNLLTGAQCATLDPSPLPPQVTEVQDQLCQLEATIGNLQAVTDRLEKRLECVYHAQPANQGQCKPSEALTAHATQIRAVTDRIRSANARLEYLEGAIQL